MRHSLFRMGTLVLLLTQALPARATPGQESYNVTLGGQRAEPWREQAVLDFATNARIVPGQGRASATTPIAAARDALFKGMRENGIEPTILRSLNLHLTLNHGATELKQLDLSRGVVKVTVEQQNVTKTLKVKLGNEGRAALKAAMARHRPAHHHRPGGGIVLPDDSVQSRSLGGRGLGGRGLGGRGPR